MDTFWAINLYKLLRNTFIIRRVPISFYFKIVDKTGKK